MATEFSLGMFNKLKIANGYLIIGKGGQTVRLIDIKAINLTKEGLVINGENAKLAVIKGLAGKKAFAVMDFINDERNKIKAAEKTSKPTKSSIAKGPKTFLLTIIIVIILIVIIGAVYHFTVSP